MSELAKIGRADVVQALFPLEGPHTAESVVAASRAVAELSRYLAHAIRYPAALVLTDPADVSVVVANFVAGARSMDQVLRQLCLWAQRLTGHPELADDRARGDVARAVAGAEGAAAWLDDARSSLSLVAWYLSEAGTDLGHLCLGRETGRESRS